MECGSEAHTITRAAGSMAGTIIQSEPNDTQHKLQSPSTAVSKSLPNMGSEIKHVLANLGVMTKAGVGMKLKSHLPKWTSILQSLIVKDVDSTFENALQPSCFNSNNGLKTTNFKVVEQVLC